MNWMDRIRSWMRRRELAVKLKNRNRNLVICNIDTAQHIGIVYNATEFVSFEIIRNLVKDLTQESRKITVLGYVDSKKLIDHYLYRKGFDFFSRNDLNWYSKPVSSVVERFIAEPFDILINLSLEDYFPIRYISALSPASFKAGKYAPDEMYLDLMIDIEKEKQTMRSLQSEIRKETDLTLENTDIEADLEKKTETEIQLSFLINQLLHYLSILKK